MKTLLLCENFIKRIKEYDKQNLAKDYSLLKTYFKNIRDWYAHGRYFKLSSPIYIPEPKEIKLIYNEFNANIFCRKK
jgi:hypothetical protein